jgi:conjugal transfer pilus assembly protein TraL
MSHPVEIPRHVDDPPTLLLWRIDDLVPVVVVVMLVLGILADQLLVFLLLGIVLVRLYGRFRDSRPDGYALHWASWVGLRGRTTPNPFIRRWLP